MSKHYKEVAKTLGVKYLFGRWGVQFLCKDPNGNIYKLISVVPLDGWITDIKEIIESFANDPDFKISYSKKDNKKGDSNDKI